MAENQDWSEARFGTTQRGKEMLIDHKFFCYTIDNEKNGRCYWKCVMKDSKRCKARAATFEGKVVYLSDNHTHLSDITRTKAKLKEQEAVARAVENPMVPPRRALAELAASASSNSELAALTPNRVLVRRINYHRKKLRETPDEPSDWEDLEDLPEGLCQTSLGERFLLSNSIGSNSPGCIIFASDWQLNLMSQADSVTADGTFSTCPAPFAQIYTVVANFHEERRNIPVLFALLPDKSAQTYEHVWSNINLYLLGPVKAIRVDFESADLLAIQEAMPDSRLDACFFHFRSAVKRKLGALGLTSAYNQDESLQLYIKSLISLAYVPEAMVCCYFEELRTTRPPNDALNKFEDYFESTFIGRRWGPSSSRRSPRYKIKFWNQFNRAVAKEDPTTNSAESWNSAWAGSLETRANLWTVIKGFQREEAFSRAKHLEGSAPPTGRQIRRSDKDSRIAAMCQSFDSYEPIAYLQMMAQQFEID